MPGFAPNMAQKIAVAGLTTAAGTYGTAYFQPGRQVCQVDYTNGTTDVVSFYVQGSNSTSAIWWNMHATVSAPTSGQTVRVLSTYSCVFDRVRISTTDAQVSATTKGRPHKFWVSAR